MSATRVIFDPKRAADVTDLPFDFNSKLQAGETIQTEIASVAVWSGVDPTPSGVLGGTISVTSNIVSVRVQAGVTGVIYAVTCTITTNNSRTLTLMGLLAIIPSGI